MDAVANTRHITRSLLSAASLVLVLIPVSGCWFTSSLGQWANQSVPRSRAVGVVGTPESGERILFEIKERTDCPDGWYAFDIPEGWQEKPTCASRWGAHIREIPEPVTSLVWIEEDAQPKRGRRVGKPSLYTIANWTRRYRPLSGRTRASGMPTRYGVKVVRHEVSGQPTADLSAEVFGYDDARDRWVHLGGVPLDAGRPTKGRKGVALLLSPASFCLDACGWTSLVFARGFNNFFCVVDEFGSGSNEFTWGEPAYPRKPTIPGFGHVPDLSKAAYFLGQITKPKVVRRLVSMLEDSDPGVRQDAATALGRIGVKDAPGALLPLVRAARDESEDVRRAAVLALKSFPRAP